MKISILLPYEKAPFYYEKWAHEEEKIDFENDAFAAERCTVSYAAEEMVHYLNILGHEAKVCDKKGEYNIIIELDSGDDGEFDIKSDENNLILHGYGRAGVLYAVYELLEAQGIRWYAPRFEYIPSPNEKLIIPENKHYAYSMSKGRGFHSEGLQKESIALVVWMARNRMNLHACFPHTVALQKKVCIRFSTGGHVFFDILNPKNITEDGRYYLDAHKEWYGQREGEITFSNARSVQFCVSNTEFLDMASDIFIDRLKNEWANEEMVELGGFDSAGKSCQCEKCKKIGNGSDIALHYLSHIRKRIDEATEKGEIKRKIHLCIPAYFGTDTLMPPENPIPKNLLKAGDYIDFCPIKRCYKHFIDDESCDMNLEYKKALEGWKKTGISIMVNEYYNVSRFQDIPILFTKTLHHDIKYYLANGAERFMYMHVPMVEWGVRTTTQYLLANLTRNADCDYERLLNEYFQNIFRQHAKEAKSAYVKVEKAMELCSSWRTWGNDTCLSALIRWLYLDGCQKPDKPLSDNSHFINENISEKGYETVRLLDEAIGELRQIREKEISSMAGHQFLGKVAENPMDEWNAKSQTALIDKLCEDIRGLLYGKDMMELLTMFVDYYYRMYQDKTEDIDELIKKIEALGRKMSEDTHGICFLNYHPDFEVQSVLRRSGLKDLYYWCVSGGKSVKN